MDEGIYRIVAGVLTLGTAVLGGTFRRRAARSREDLWNQRRREGVVLLALRGIGGLALFGVLLAHLVAPGWVEWARLPLPHWLRWLGAALGVAALPLLGWVLAYLGPNLTDTVAIRRAHTLVTGGPYRFVRHPFYVATSLSLLGLALLLASWPMALGLLAFWVYLTLRTPLEEARLAEHFGDAYRAYAARTGRFLPRLAR